MNENVNHPSHYNQPGKKECIVEMREQFGDVATYWFCRLNAYKYRYRAGNKEGNSSEQDIAKAEWYEAYAEDLHKAMLRAGMAPTTEAVSFIDSEQKPDVVVENNCPLGIPGCFADCSTCDEKKSFEAGWAITEEVVR